MADKVKGSVKWFNDMKGYGFVTDGQNDYFVHYSDIQGSGRKTLEPHQEIEFKADKNAKGLRAREVQAV